MNRSGIGHIYKRGRIWWVKWYRRGKAEYESSKSVSKADAEALLRKRMRGGGAKSEERISYEDLEAGILEDYQVNQYRSFGDLANVRLKHLGSFFRGQRAVDITTPRLRKYILMRRKQGAAAETIRGELSSLRRMFTIAKQDGALSQTPHFPMPEPGAAREIYVTAAEFAAILKHLPEENHDIVRFLWNAGWRISAAIKLEWRDVNLDEGFIVLRAENAKNKRAQRLPLVGELAEIIERASSKRSLKTPLIFHYQDGRSFHRSSVSRAFRKASIKAGMRKTIHDLRRSVSRDLIRTGIVSEDVAMKITGHRTRAVFSRYNITADDDLALAQAALTAYRGRQPGATTVKPLRKAAK